MEWHDHWHINKNLWIIITIKLNFRHWNFEDLLQINKIYIPVHSLQKAEKKT